MLNLNITVFNKSHGPELSPQKNCYLKCPGADLMMHILRLFK